jgi:uncharacterized CHY-type Zn-finger protein
MKRCYLCHQELDEHQFYTDSYSNDGLTSACRECLKKKSRENFKNNPLTDAQKAARRAAYQKWKKNNPDRLRELQRKKIIDEKVPL